MSFALGGVVSVVVVSIASSRYNRAVRSTCWVTSVWLAHRGLAQGSRSFHNTVSLGLNGVGKATFVRVLSDGLIF
uniref:Putative secreted protein n=1 Tax=Ixodes ricinus TaxID=34613 RepID=A0A6B0TTB5_IXORI